MQVSHLVRGLHQANIFRGFSQRAEDLVMPFVSDEKDDVTFASETDGFEVNLGDQRTGGVNGVEIALGGGGADGRGDAVSAIKDVGPVRNLVNAVDKDDAAFA